MLLINIFFFHNLYSLTLTESKQHRKDRSIVAHDRSGLDKLIISFGSFFSQTRNAHLVQAQFSLLFKSCVELSLFFVERTVHNLDCSTRQVEDRLSV